MRKFLVKELLNTKKNRQTFPPWVKEPTIFVHQILKVIHKWISKGQEKNINFRVCLTSSIKIIEKVQSPRFSQYDR